MIKLSNFFLSFHLQLHQEVLGKGKRLPLLELLVGGGGWGDGGMGVTQSASFFLNTQQRSAKLPSPTGNFILS